MATIKQKWARRRNWRKAQLNGMSANLFGMFIDPCLLASEAKQLKRAENIVNAVLDTWDGNNAASRANFLTVSKMR